MGRPLRSDSAERTVTPRSSSPPWRLTVIATTPLNTLFPSNTAQLTLTATTLPTLAASSDSTFTSRATRQTGAPNRPHLAPLEKKSTSSFTSTLPPTLTLTTLQASTLAPVKCLCQQSARSKTTPPTATPCSTPTAAPSAPTLSLIYRLATLAALVSSGRSSTLFSFERREREQLHSSCTVLVCDMQQASAHGCQDLPRSITEALSSVSWL